MSIIISLVHDNACPRVPRTKDVLSLRGALGGSLQGALRPHDTTYPSRGRNSIDPIKQNVKRRETRQTTQLLLQNVARTNATQQENIVFQLVEIEGTTVYSSDKSSSSRVLGSPLEKVVRINTPSLCCLTSTQLSLPRYFWTILVYRSLNTFKPLSCQGTEPEVRLRRPTAPSIYNMCDDSRSARVSAATSSVSTRVVTF